MPSRHKLRRPHPASTSAARAWYSQVAQMRRGSALFIAQRQGQTELVKMLQKDNEENGFAEPGDPEADVRRSSLPPHALAGSEPSPRRRAPAPGDCWGISFSPCGKSFIVNSRCKFLLISEFKPC